MSLNIGKASKVGDYPANPWGFFDMHGSVWEWCADWYDDYPSELAKLTQSVKLARSGFSEVAPGTTSVRDLQFAHRGSVTQDFRHPAHGFRLCLAPAR